MIGGTKLSNQGKVTLWGVHGGEGESEIQRRDLGGIPRSPSPVKLQEFKEKAGAEGDRLPEAELLAIPHPHPPTSIPPPPPLPLLSILNQARLTTSILKNPLKQGFGGRWGAKKSSGMVTEENRKGRKGS